MKKNELISIQSEISQVSALLDRLGQHDVFSRVGLERRLETLRGQLAVERPIKFQSKLTFKGAPVVGTHGISAAFGAKAISAFSDAVVAIGASLRGNLSARGPVPDRADFEMLITGTAIGSFGFELESRSGSLVEGGTIDEAVEKAQIVLEASSREEDDALAEAVVDLDRRALVAVRAFTEVLSQNGAFCTLETERRKFSFDSSLDVARSFARLADENISEEESAYTGVLIGVLPESRSIEFREVDGSILKGKVDRSVGDLSGWSDFLHKFSSMNCRVTRVGDGKPKYLFLGSPELLEGGFVSGS